MQSVPAPGLVDLGPGYLGTGLLPVDLLRDAYCRAMSEFGAAILSYGNNRGALPLRSALASATAAREGQDCGPEHLMITAGTSHALHLIATGFAAGSVVFVDQTCYDLGRQIFRDCGLTLRDVPGDSSGMDPEALDQALRIYRASAAFIYLSPTFHNPTGIVIPAARRKELLAVAAGHEITIVEDDAYCDVTLSLADPPPSLAALAAGNGVIRLRTFSKSLAPGLRLGWLQADPRFVERFVSHGLFASGGSVNHTTALAVLAMLRSGDYVRHVTWLRTQLRARRDALAGSLRENLPDGFEFTTPDGGFFIWVRCPRRLSEADLLTTAEHAGIRVAGGSRFGSTARPCLRLAYSFYDPGRLGKAGRRLATALETRS